MAFQLSPGDPVSCYIMALLDAEEGRWADSITHFQRSAQLQTSRWQDAVNLYIHYFHRPDMAVKLAGDDVEELRQVAATIRAFGKDPALGPTTGPATQPADEALASQAEQRAADLVRAAADQPDAPPSTMAERGLLCFKERDFPAAIKYLGKALKYDYGEVDWRLAYAQSYAEIGNKDEAMRQARIILRERPQMSEAQDLIDLLNRPTTQALDGLLR
jgi:tetratricopeptide (TPR) repeat protein